MAMMPALVVLITKGALVGFAGLFSSRRCWGDWLLMVFSGFRKLQNLISRTDSTE